MPQDKLEKKLLPFEQSIKNMNDFCDNMQMFESVALMVEAAEALNLSSSTEEYELAELDEMLKSTLISFSEYIEDRGGLWN
jgi:hypothetical protein|tara:strand:- start:330 stop:572 length:243 start_codon:yes stop_codon:yes gene_type:complete